MSFSTEESTDTNLDDTEESIDTNLKDMEQNRQQSMFRLIVCV